MPSRSEAHPAVEHFRALARELAVVLPVSVFERANNAFYNSVVIVDADGSVLGSYRKSHIPEGPGYHEKFYFSPGDTGFKVFDTRYAKLGVAICWDQWFPEAARAMALMGADMLLYPTAIGSEPQDPGIDSSGHWQRTMQGHAAANIMPLVASNRIGTEKGEKYTMTFYGSSFIASHTGEKVAEADRGQRDGADRGVRSGRDPPLPAVLGRVPRSPARSVLPAAVARWPRLRIFRTIWYSSTWRRRAGTRPMTGLPRSASCASRTASWSRNGVRWSIPSAPYRRTSNPSPASAIEMVAGAPRFAEIAAVVLEKLRDAVFVAHNARFDYSFLRSEFRQADVNFSAKVLCTVKLSRRLFPEYPRHNLDAVMERNGFTCGARHRALGDARVLA